jgi:transcriptional regulator with XRE-family HTH domain
MTQGLGERLAQNVRQLRDARGMTQQQMAKASGLPRATWSNLESGAANPTLGVLHCVAVALQVSVEELIGRPPTGTRHFPRGSLPTRTQGCVSVRRLLPDRIPGVVIERMELPPASRLIGVPHTTGTREYLTCEQGEITLVAAGEQWMLGEGDVVAFRGDQRHSYFNRGARTAVGYSVVLLEPVA